MLAAELVAPRRRADLTTRPRGCSRARASARRSSGSRTSSSRCSTREWIDLPVASVDAVLCRWGYMLMADPAAALRGDAPRAAPGRACRARRVGLARRQSLGDCSRRQRAGRARGSGRAAGAGRVRDRSRSSDRERLAELLEHAGFAEMPGRGARAQPPSRRASTSCREPRSTSRPRSTTPCSSAPRPRSPRSSALRERFAPYLAADGRRSRRADACERIGARPALSRARRHLDSLPPMIYDDDADLHTARRQDRRDHRLRLPGPRPRPQPEGLRRRRRRRPAPGLRLASPRRASRASRCVRSSRPPAAATS